MTETQKINSVLREIFGLPITAEQRLTLFFTWGLFEPLDPRAEKKGKHRAYCQDWDSVNREKSRAIKRKWYDHNEEEVKAAARARYAANPEEQKQLQREWRLANAEKATALKRAWALANPEKVKASSLTHRRQENFLAGRREYRRKRNAEDPSARIMESLRGRIGMALKRNTKGARTRELLDMDIKEFRIYLQGQFKPGMTWDNHGDVWEIDHIRPCASFNLTEVTQQRECFHWSNMQPLFKYENRRKGANF